MLIHPLFAYTTLIVALAVFLSHLLNFTLLKNASVLRYTIMLHGILIVLSIFAVLAGFSVSRVPLVQSKIPFLWGFPHKWNGVLLFLYTLTSFIFIWLKGKDIGRKGIVISLLGLLLVLFQLITGWMLRLVFFA
ncbi:MAG: hypothetical protein ACK4SM_00710 [Aquificaceae bacterium]